MNESLYTLLVLILMLPLIIGVVYCLKRITAQPFGKQTKQPINITHQLSLGSKERLMCVEINGVSLLLGVTPQAISALHVFTSNATNLCPKDPA
ncbi:MAG: flagellar biosynthetic protein FliO [Legionellales bacterium]